MSASRCTHQPYFQLLYMTKAAAHDKMGKDWNGCTMQTHFHFHEAPLPPHHGDKRLERQGGIPSHTQPEVRPTMKVVCSPRDH